jgi:hypothetical protein
LRVFNISAMPGNYKRDWRELRGESNVSARAEIISVDKAPEALSLLKLPHQLRQLGDIRRDPPRLVFGERLGRRSPAVLIKKAPTGERWG